MGRKYLDDLNELSLQAYLLHSMILNDFRVIVGNMRTHEEEVTDNSLISPSPSSHSERKIPKTIDPEAWCQTTSSRA